MFSKEISINSGLILSENSESVLNTSIHMLFMRYDISAIWIDRNWIVVDKLPGKKMASGLFLSPSCNACIRIEFFTIRKFYGW